MFRMNMHNLICVGDYRYYAERAPAEERWMSIKSGKYILESEVPPYIKLMILSRLKENPDRNFRNWKADFEKRKF